MRQLEYQRAKAATLRGREQETMAWMARRSLHARARLESVQHVPADARVLEVGSGAHGLIFFFGGARDVGVDPLAADYAGLFPAWQGRALTAASGGERLPFGRHSFDVVLCDNVVDHAESPRRIVEEIARVLRPGGLLYFTVNVHHPIYSVASRVHGAWTAVGLRYELSPFADHTVHLTVESARALFRGLPLELRDEQVQMRSARESAAQIRHAGDRLKKLFFKNARFELIAKRRAG